MKLSKEQVKHVANLAQLQLSDAEVMKFSRQLSSILDYVGLLDEVDTSSIPSTFQTTGLKNVTHEDSSSKERCLTQDQVLSNAKEIEGSCIKAEAVL